MKRKTLIFATMVAAMVALAGCGKEDIPEKKDKSKIENVAEKMPDDFVEYLEKEKENSREQFPEKKQEETENAPTLTVIPHIRETFPEITIGDDIVLKETPLTGKQIIIGDLAFFTVSEDWIIFDPDRGIRTCLYKEKNAPAESYAYLMFAYDKILQDISFSSWFELETHIINNLNMVQASSSETITNLSYINVNGYDGYYYEIERADTTIVDSIHFEIYMNGYSFSVSVGYFDVVDPAVKEDAIASAMEVISTLTPIKKAK